MRRNTSLISRAPRGSRPTIGSSTSTAFGRCRNAALITSRCFMPCEKLSTSSSCHFPSSKISSISLMRVVDVALVHAVEPGVEAEELARGQLLVDERAIGDEAERRLRRLGFGCEVVTVDEDAAGVGFSRPAIIRMVVVLPAPFGPRKP